MRFFNRNKTLEAYKQANANLILDLMRRVQEIRLLNRAIQRQKRRTKVHRERARALTAAAINLRLAQRHYMALKYGNGSFDDKQDAGIKVAQAAAVLDSLLPEQYARHMTVETQIVERNGDSAPLTASELRSL